MVVDSTQDSFGSQRVVKYECRELIEKTDELVLTGCAGDGEVVDISIP